MGLPTVPALLGVGKKLLNRRHVLPFQRQLELLQILDEDAEGSKVFVITDQKTKRKRL